MVPKALLYHEDINFVEPIKFVRGEYQWPVIEKRLKGMVSHTNKLFSPL
jgi:hypothetical protein